ncbi:MAG TPA: hypothetical protein VI461_04160, partial [Chitinophagaceae bacterium]|nr:hypothetical protein [Chitinophagaceae bacterium]
NNVALCSQRQRRILADAMLALKKDGVLIYSTCSYSKEEDEGVVEWLERELKVKSQKLKVESNWNIVEVDPGNGYRFWPDKIKGEGFFIACFKKTDGHEDADTDTRIKRKAEIVSKKEIPVIEKWMEKKDHQYVKNENTMYAWPGSLVNDMNFILSNLRVIYSGVRVGELMKDKLVPDHALAMSRLVADSISRVDLNYELAIQYLQRKDLKIDTAQKGWQLVVYEGHLLGWINALSGRINNYYPKGSRILKDK